MLDKIAMLATAVIIIRRRRRSDARRGMQLSPEWLMERQSDKGMEEFVVTKLATNTGGFHSFLWMKHDQFTELLSYVEPFISDNQQAYAY